MNKTPATVGIVIVVLIILSGILYWVMVRNHTDATHQTQPPAIVLPPVSRVPAAPPTHGVIYVASKTGGDDNALVSEPIAFTHSHEPARDALNALAGSPNSPLPSGTHLRGVKIEDGLATVDFTRDFKDNFHGGDTQESQVITAVQRTMGQFPQVSRVQILVEGTPIESLGGMADISGPMDVIRPDPIQQAKAVPAGG